MNNIQIKNKTFRAVLLVVLSVMFAVFGASFFGSYQKTETLNVEQETVYAALSGSGTADSPYTISSPAQMVEFAGLVNGGNSYSGKYFILTADIDLSGKVWTPIGDKPSSGTAHPFAGIFDGNGCTITGLTINMTLNVPCYGLFGYVKGSSASNRAIIRNVKLEGVNINGSSASYSGAVVGYAENAYILDCSSAGNVTSSGSYSVGGVLGYSGSNVTVKGCYSYASVKSGSYAGGIVGRTASSSTIAVKQCFFGGNLTGSASYTGGIVGSAGSSIIINDVFGGDYGYKGGTSTKYVVTDKANWITDVTDKNGNTLMSYYVTIDSSKKVLKGVGNIVVAYKNYQFQSGAYNTTTPVDKQEALLYSLTSKNTANDASATTTLDNSCNLYSEKSQTTITKSNYTFSKITLTRVNGAASKTAFASAASVDIYPTNNLNAYTKGGYIKFSTGSSWTNTKTIDSSNNYYTIAFSRSVQGYYTIEAYTRGVWRKTYATAVTYTNPSKTSADATTKIKTTISLATNTLKVGIDDTVAKVTDLWTNNSTTVNTSGNKFPSFYVPHNETYTITFANNVSGYDYLANMQDFAVGNETNSSPSTIATTTRATNMNTALNATTGTTAIEELLKTKTKTSTAITAANTLHTYYFDNAQKLFLNLNFDEEDLCAFNNSNIGEISNNKPFFLGKNGTRGDASITTYALIDESLKTKGIAYEDNGSLKQVSGSTGISTTANDSKAIYPMWAKYTAASVKDKNGTALLTNSNGFGGALTFSTSAYRPVRASSSAYSQCYWYVNWDSTTETIAVNNMFVADGVKDSNGNSITAEAKDYVSQNKVEVVSWSATKPAGNGTSIKNAANQVTVTSVQKLYFSVQAQGGYYLSAMNFGPTYGDKVDVLIPEINGTFTTISGQFRYAGCNEVLNLDDELKVLMSYKIEFNEASNIYTISVSGAIGLSYINFEYKPKTFYGSEIKTSINADIKADKSPLKVGITRGATTALSKTAINNTGTLVDFRFREIHKITITDIADGYYLDNNITDEKSDAFRSFLKVNVKAPTGISSDAVTWLITNFTRTVSNGKITSISFDFQITYADPRIDSFSLVLDVKKSQTKFNLEVTNANYDYGTFALEYKIFELDAGGNYKERQKSSSAGSGTTLKINDIIVYTGEKLEVSVKYPAWASVATETFTNLDNKATIGKSNGVGEYKVDFTNFAHADGTVVNAVFGMLVKSTKISISQEIDGTPIKVISDFSIKYGTTISAVDNKESGVITVSVYDPHTDTTVAHNFEYDVTLIDEAKSKIVLGEKGKTGSDFAVTGFSKTLSGDDNSNSWFGLNSDAKDIALTVDLTSSTAQVYIGYVKIARGQTKITGAKVTKNEVTQGSDITETATAPTGYEFVGWSLHSYSTSAQSPENSNYNTTYTTAEIKLTLNVSKAGRVNLAYSPFIYIIAVYRAKLYTVDFATTVTDGPSKAALTTSLVYPGQKTVQVEFAKTYTKAEYIALFPTLTINGMYNFTGWDSTTNGSNTVLYQNGAWNTAEFKLNDSANLNNAQGTVTFSVIYTAKTIKINLFVDGTDSGKDGSVVYGTNVYNMGGFTPSKKAYNFTGWEYSGTMYAPATGTAKVYDIQLAEVRFDAKFVEKEIPLVISAGTNGQKFPNGQNEIKGGTIKVGQNNITSAIFDKDFKLTAVPTWDATFAKFEFRGFIFVNSDKVIIPTGYENNNFTKGKTSYVFTAEDIDDGSATPVVTIYAYYEMVDITNPSAGADAVDTAWSISGNNCSFTYDAGNHNLRITEDNKASGIIKYSYNWKRSGTTVSSKNTAAIKTVAESGKYVCQVTATTNVFNAMGTIVEDSNEVNVTVNKKKLDVTQNGKPVTKSEPIVKTFDNTIKVDAEDNVDYLGKCGSDVVVVNITFPNVNVGSNYQLIPELSGKDSNNYYVDTTTLYGKVIQYVLHLELKDTAEDFVYKVGADNKQINIKEKYQLVEEDTAFLTKNGFSFDYTIVTNQNKIGQYTHNGATNKFVYTLTVGAAGAQSANFDIQAVPFRIIDKDANSLVVNIMVVTNDYPGKTDEVISSSIAILTATGLPESSSGNKTSEIIVIETKDYFKSNKDIPLQLGIQSAYASYYRVEKWKVLLDNSEQANSFGTSSNITYTVTNTTVKEITIRVYITRLKTITLDYNVVNKSEVTQGYLEDLKTVIALGETVNTSKNTYNSNFPLTVVRPGWKFNGWKVNNTVVKSDTLWTFQGDKLVASWSIDDIVVDANQKSINSVYTGDSITETIEIKNKNETSLTYSYAWTTTATVPGSYSNATLTVKDVNNSGTYTLTITASDGSLSITKTCTIVVKIQKYQLLKDNISIDKEYDADSSAVYVVTGVKSEVITISGNYYGSAAGSKLNKATLSYKGKIDKTTIEIDINNYSIDAKYISEDSKINVKQITFSPENQSKSYSRNDKTPLVYTGNYNVGKVKFSYQISTPSAEVGEYKDDALVVTIISGDVESNFSFTVQSTFTIGKEKLNNSNISWIGDTKVTFDGKSHKLELQPELQDIVAKYTYTNQKGENLASQYAVYAGTYTVTVIVVTGDINYEIEETLKTTLVIEKRTISVSYNGAKYTRDYDGTAKISTLAATVNGADDIENAYKPVIRYDFKDSLAGTNKDIIASLASANANLNESYTISQDQIVGDITKIKTAITVTATKVYDGKEDFAVAVKNPANNKIQITAINLLKTEGLTGTITYKVRKAGTYTNAIVLEFKNDLNIGAYKYSVNYEITSITYNLVIEKAEIRVDNLDTSTEYVYTGEEVSIAYSVVRTDAVIGAETPKTLMFTYQADTSIDATTSLDDDKAVQVGTYNYKLVLIGEDAENFKISANSEDEGAFTITKREIIIYFSKTIPYDPVNGVVYSSADYPTDTILQTTSTLGTGDTIEWEMIPSGKEVRVYSLTVEEDFTKIEINLFKNNLDYNKNYIITVNSLATIQIGKRKVDFSQLVIEGLTGTYNAATQEVVIKVAGLEEPFDYTRIVRQNGAGETPLPTANDIYYAGTYTLEFSMRNYTVENLRPITKVISPYEVDIMPVAGTITKEYDGNINVDKAFIVMNPAKKFFASDKDKIEVLGTYDSPKAAKNKPITYFLTNSYSEVFYSYKLLTTAGTGEITPANIYLALDQKHIIYYNGENVKIDATSFGNANKINQQTGLFEKTFIGNETLTGIITLNQTNAGEYKLSEYADSISMVLQVVTLGVPGDASNYKIHFATKTNTAVVIRKAEVQIDIKDADKIYNALIQEPTYETEIYSLNGNPRGKLIESEFNSVISYTYKLSGTQTVTDPVNAGNYDIVISVPDNSNYILIKDVAGTAVTSYTVANGPLKIAKRKIAVKVSGIVDRLIKLTIKNGEIEYPEDWVAEYQVVSKTDVYDPSMNKNNGLIAGHIFSATLKTDKGIAGFYTINPVVSIDGEIVGSIVKPEEFSVTNNGVELKDNYEVVSYSAVIRVYAVSDFDASELEGLVYDSTDKVASEKIKVYLIVDSKVFTYIYGKDSVFSNLKYNGTSTNKVELAGNYSFTITAEPVPGHVQTKDIEFTVAQKVISKVSLTKDKQYDAAKTIIGSVSSTDICAGDTVTINAYYTNGVEDIAFVGVHKIRFELVGADAANYNINDLVITGEIKQREITISLDSSVAKQTYSNNTFAIDAAKVNVTSATKLVTGETLNGSVLLTKVDFGEYTFSLENANLDNLKILVQNSGADVTSNYKFTLSGKYQIQAKLIELAVSTIDFTYNAEIQKIDSNLSIANPTANEQFNTLAMQNVNIVYDKEVVNAGNYVATISSNTTNFEYKVNGYANNKIPFVVKQRIVTVNVGTVEYKYNPTSAYVTTIKNEHIVNILAKHNVTGTYKLNGIGKGVGEYNANADGSGDIVFSVGIFVNGENLVGTNYQIDKYIGTIKITPFEVTEFYLINNSFVYSKSNAADKVEVAFVDANNETQIITMADGKWGKFTVNQGTNKNVSAVDVGSYFVEVEIYNCTLATNVLDFDITKFTITDITYNANKQYDGTSAVKNSGGKTELTSSQIFEGDTLKITAFYQDKDTGLEATDVGTYTIVFVIDSTVGDYRNYQVIMTSEGTIVRKTVAIELIDKEFTYRPDGLYVVSFDKDNRPFTAVSYGRLVQDSYLFGSISITKPDYIGVLDNEAFNLSNLKVYDKENKEQTSNYSITITGENKTIKAKVAIDFGSQIDFEYTAQQVNFDPVLSFTNADADLTADISLVTFRYKSDTYDSADKPVKVGEYLLTLTLVSNCYEFEGNNKFGFKINTHTYIVTPDQIPTTQKVYGDADPILDFKVFTDLGEIVDISLTRDAGEDVGSYNVYLASWKNNNYVIEFGENTGFEAFVITKATMLNVVIKDTTKTRNTLKKVYDTVAVPEIDITNVDYTATYRGVEVSTETLSGKIYFESGVNVGNYKLVSWVITSHNFENFTLTSEVDFAITPKVIQVACNNTVKPFDNSKTFFGTIDILDENGNPINSSVYPLVIDGEYIQQEVGDNVRIALSYTGDSITNYTLEVDYLIGKIRKRNVNVIPDSDQSSVYSKAATAFDILYQVTDGEIGFEFFGELTDFITGNLYISKISEKFIAGKYDILNGLNAEYFDIAFTSGIKYTILQKELTITNSENFEKIYDGKTNVIGTFEVEGIEPGDIVEVSATFYDKDITAPNIDVSDNKVVVFRLTGDDSLNYFAQNVAGAIKPKEVILNFSYIPTTYTMHNSDRIENNKEASAVLTYLQKVSYKVMALPTPTHEGYTFEGWYFDQDYSVEITLDTLIDDPLWEIDVNEKTAYAKWTIKQFNVELIEATRVNGVYRTGSAYPGGTVVKSWNGLYDYWSEFNLTGLATANDGYVFNCYSDDLTGAPTEAIQDNKLRVYAKENYVYARFDPVEITIVLKANGGTFTQVAKWEFSTDFTTATIVVEYNQTLAEVGTTLPTVARRGYTHDTSKWLDTDNTEYPITENTLIAADYYPERELYAVWIANEYNLTVYANEGYFATYDSDLWTVAETNADSQVIRLTKTVTYDKEVGILADPYRKGWGFGGYEGMTEDYIWDYIADVEISAIWLEQEFELKVNSQRGNVEVVIFNNQDTVIDNYVLNTAEVTNIIIKVKTTNKAVIIVTQNVGYEFTDWTTDVDNIADLTETQININQFLESQVITANYTPRVNKITLVINRTDRGTLKGSLSSDPSIIVTTTNDVDTVEIYAKTEDQVLLLVNPFEGYEVGSWEVEAEEKYGLAGGLYDTERLLFDFVWDLTVIVNIVPKDIDITIISTIEKGAISIENAIEGVEYYTHSVPTESPLEFRITVNHGYHVVTDLANWAYETASVNKGTFVVELETEGVYKITFTGFTATGTIRVPFERNTYTVTFVNVYFDESYEIDRAAKEIVSVTRGENTITLNSNDSFDDLYLNEAKITPIYVKEGYTFKYWSTESNKTLPIIPSEGLIDTYENGAIDMQVLDNITLYLIYVINEYTITYSTNDADKGVLAYNNDESEGRDQFAVVLKYGRTTKPVTAVPNSVNNFVFSHWVIVDSEGNETEYSKSKEIIIDAVTKDLTFKAIFRGNEITITINVTLPESELIGNYTELDKEELYFSEITFDGTVGTPSFNKDGLIQSWTFKTYAGENVGFTFTEKNGYVFAYCNPYLNMEAAVSGSQGPIPFTTSTLYYSASYDIAMKARTNTVLIKIINNKGTDPKGANIFEDHNNSLGIENVEIIGDQKALEYQVKTGGSIQAFLNIYEGYIFDYMSVAAYFNEPTQAVDSDIYISTGEIKNISSDMEILLYVRPYVYEVTFEYNYEGAPVSVVAQVEIGELDFTPALPESIFGPNRPKYNFIGWSMDKAYQTETTYLFDNGQIYRYEYVDYNAVKVYGFNGTSNAVASTKEGVDFECTLYAYWELIKHKVDVVFVPTTALQNSNINYTQMFPNTEGRYLRFADDFSQRVEGISYVPEVLVEIVAPGCYEGYEYYGWSYDGDITNKAKINVGKYSQIMIEEDIVVYLYYTLEVKVISNGHGTVTPESAKVLYNGTISLDGKPDAAYLFDRWVLNGNIIPNSKQKMDVTITEPSNIEAIYLGEEINIILEQVTGGTVKFLGTNNTEQAIYRVGDTVMFEVVDIKYGYYNKEWTGEFEGVVINNEYVVSPNDAIKKYAKFKMTIAPQNMIVRFMVDGGMGGQFIVDGESTIHVDKTYLYDSPLSFDTTIEDRFEIVSLTVNGTAINTTTKGFTVNKENNLLINITNEIKLTFRQMLWTDIYEMFNGFGTEKDPYVITNEQQLAAMAYLINNAVDSEGKIPYARGYYILKKNMDLNARFWQPIGTKENPFGGTFNFAECVVSNIILDKFYEVTSYNGLFGVCSADADFLTVPPNFGTTLIIIIAVSATVIVVGAGLGIYLARRRKRVRRLSNQSQIAMSKLQAQNQADMAAQEAPEKETPPSEKDTQ